MARPSSDVVVKTTFSIEIAATATGWLDVIPLDILGVRGRIVSVKMRQDSGGDITTADIFIADRSLAPMTATDPPDEYVVLKYPSTTCTPSDTDAFMEEYPEADGNGYYYCATDGDIALGINIIAVGGNGPSTLTVDIIAKSQGNVRY